MPRKGLTEIFEQLTKNSNHNGTNTDKSVSTQSNGQITNAIAKVLHAIDPNSNISADILHSMMLLIQLCRFEECEIDLTTAHNLVVAFQDSAITAATLCKHCCIQSYLLAVAEEERVVAVGHCKDVSADDDDDDEDDDVLQGMTHGSDVQIRPMCFQKYLGHGKMVSKKSYTRCKHRCVNVNKACTIINAVPFIDFSGITAHRNIIAKYPCTIHTGICALLFLKYDVWCFCFVFCFV
jgi:hypothetical protein